MTNTPQEAVSNRSEGQTTNAGEELNLLFAELATLRVENARLKTSQTVVNNTDGNSYIAANEVDRIKSEWRRLARACGWKRDLRGRTWTVIEEMLEEVREKPALERRKLICSTERFALAHLTGFGISAVDKSLRELRGYGAVKSFRDKKGKLKHLIRWPKVVPKKGSGKPAAEGSSCTPVQHRLPDARAQLEASCTESNCAGCKDLQQLPSARALTNNNCTPVQRQTSASAESEAGRAENPRASAAGINPLIQQTEARRIRREHALINAAERRRQATERALYKHLDPDHVESAGFLAQIGFSPGSALRIVLPPKPPKEGEELIGFPEFSADQWKRVWTLVNAVMVNVRKPIGMVIKCARDGEDPEYLPPWGHPSTLIENPKERRAACLRYATENSAGTDAEPDHARRLRLIEEAAAKRQFEFEAAEVQKAIDERDVRAAASAMDAITLGRLCAAALNLIADSRLRATISKKTWEASALWKANMLGLIRQGWGKDNT